MSTRHAIEFLVDQHRSMERALRELLEVAPEGGARKEAFERAADELMSHVTIEEEIFYPAVKRERTEDILLESLEEHLSLKRVLADLVELDVGDARFEAKLHVLREQAEHHHEEEETHLFPKVERLFDKDRLNELGTRMAERQRELLEGAPRCAATEQTEAATELA